MWYKIKYDDKDALMFFNGTTRSIHFADDIENHLHLEYLAWVAEGNTAEEWTGE
jgi:hypothetical protein